MSAFSIKLTELSLSLPMSPAGRFEEQWNALKDVSRAQLFAGSGGIGKRQQDMSGIVLILRVRDFMNCGLAVPRERGFGIESVPGSTLVAPLAGTIDSTLGRLTSSSRCFFSKPPA